MKFIVNLKDFDLEGSFREIRQNIISVSGVKLHQFLIKNSPKDTTRLATNWKLTTTSENAKITNDVPYVEFVNNGTGVFGKSGKPITPKSPNGVLVFQKGGETIFTRRVQGQKGQKFVEKSIEELERELPRIISNGV